MIDRQNGEGRRVLGTLAPAAREDHQRHAVGAAGDGNSDMPESGPAREQRIGLGNTEGRGKAGRRAAAGHLERVILNRT